MASNHARVKVGEVASVTDYVANGSFAALKANVQYLESPGYAVLVRVADHNAGWNGNYVWVDRNAYEFLRKSELRVGDLVLSNVGSVGVCFRAPDLGVPMTLGPNAVMCRTTAPERLHQDYLYYFFSSSVGQNLLRSISTGSVQTKFNKTHLRQAELILPPLKQQANAADVLLSLDRRIESLRQTNTTLEAIAQALFKSWFVDFDPVRAKAEGREPQGMDAATAALFPSEFEDSELGPIPKGWRVDEIGRVVACVGGATPSTKDESFWADGTHHWATPKDLSGLQAPILTTTERLITDAAVARISSGLLPAGTLLMSSRAPIGYLAIAAVPTAINQGFIAMPPGGQLPPSYLLFWARSNMELVKQKANGSTFMEISKAAFRPIKVCVPSPAVIDAFAAIAEPLLKRIELNEHHKAALTETRDTLLPRLVSGKLRLPEAATVLEELTENTGFAEPAGVA